MDAYRLALGVLGVWRVTHLLNAEDGPANVLVRARQRIGSGLVGQMLDCFHCLSLWVAVPFALCLCETWGVRIGCWLALSGGAILLERLTTQPPPAAYRED